jgi:UDP-N-acetylglucosamine:LPS N-acetylglucosamine transferase
VPSDGSGVEAVVPLPLDVPDGERVDDAATCVPLPSTLHYAPIGVAGLRQRAAALASWFASAEPAALVVDVSVEVALLARLSGVAPVVVRQHGDRNDPAHRAAYDGAAALLAPWPSAFEDASTPQEIRDRTWYVGGITRSAARTLDRQDARTRAGLPSDRPVLVVLAGAGGTDVSLTAIGEVARGIPRWHVTVLGMDPSGCLSVGGGLDVRGWVDDPAPFLRGADVVVTHAGDNAVTEVAAAEARTIVIPAARPFDEQVHKARRLAALGVAVVVPTWPAPDRWPALLRRAGQLDPAGLAVLADGDGAQRAADHLDGLVAELAA